MSTPIKPASMPRHLNFGSVPAPSVHDWDDMNEWQRVLWIASASTAEHNALRMRLGPNSHQFAGACKAFDVLVEGVTKPHPHWAYRVDMIKHFQSVYGVADPVAEIAAALAGRDVPKTPKVQDDLLSGK